MPETCRPEFPYRHEWMGGDAAYSVPLTDTRTLWLFGDTFGTPAAAGPAGSEGGGALRRSAETLLLGNTIAISRCGPEQPWSIDYYWGDPLPGRPRQPFFAPLRGAAAGAAGAGPGGEASGRAAAPVPPADAARERAPADGRGERFHWPLDGFLHEGVLYVGLLEVDAAWTFYGTWLARVDNPQDPPGRWRITYARMTRHPTVFPGFAAVVGERFVHLFASIVRGDTARRRILTRLPLGELARRTAPERRSAEPLAAAFDTYAGDGTWRPGVLEDGAEILMEDSATEMSVERHPEIGRYAAVYIEVGDLPAEHIVYRTAPALTGPWSPPAPLYRIPETTPGSPAYDADTVCYAGKEHEAFHEHAARRLRLTLTYVCSSLEAPELYRDLELYHPVVVRTDLPSPGLRPFPVRATARDPRPLEVLPSEGIPGIPASGYTDSQPESL